MGKLINLVGRKFGRLTVLKCAGKNKHGYYLWLCKCGCGNEKIISGHSLKQGRTKSCGCWKKELLFQKGKRLIGSNNPCWKGGKTINKGYIMIYIGNHKYKMEHILMMEQYLERKLLKTETVHHKNGIRNDNRLENLELWNSRHPKGQKIKDMVKFCEDYLKIYAPNKLNKEMK